MTYNEADTRANLIDPRLNTAGWTRSQVTREHYYKSDHTYTAGRITLRGDRAQRQAPRRVDYLLRYTEGFPIAVVEAKEEGKPATSGLQQAKDYARDLGIAFAYATNGREIIEWDSFTNQTQYIDKFPTPDELWERWRFNTNLTEPPSRDDFTRRIGELRPAYSAQDAATRKQNPLLHPYAPPTATRGKTPRYFQEVAIKEVLLRIMRGQTRILLTMATGTGKTFTAFQIVWKLINSGWLRIKNDGRPGRILFLADRVVLRDQAYNAFTAFATSTSDARFLIDGRQKLTLNRDLYFAIYQNLWVEDNYGERLFEKFPADFFDMVIIDEAHRSGFGTWKEILDHFDTAVHLGMTATPKQDENIDTYAYFCAEEPAVVATEEGTVVRKPAYSYSLGQGIEDGFLATYKIHWIRTNVDKEGLNVAEALESGADIFVPEDVQLQSEYLTPQFERAITIPERTEVMTTHLAQLMRRFGPTHKTMIFCVDMAHAQEVARQLNNHFADLGFGDDYAVAIVSEEGETGRRRLQQFQDSDKKLPVIATTAELLSTGVDVPSVRNIVFMKTLRSPILFKQIIGRGTRIDADTGKLWFRIIDYTGATHLIDEEWDKPPLGLEDGERQREPQNAILTGMVQAAETNDLLVGATVAVMAAPNDQRGPILTDDAGCFRFENLPAGAVTLIASGRGFRQRQMQLVTAEGIETECLVELKPVGEKRGKIKVRGLEVEIAEEATFIVEGMNEPMTLEEYINYTRQKVIDMTQNWVQLLAQWQETADRQALREQFHRANIYPDVLAEVLEQPEVDEVDLLGHVAYERDLRSRYDRSLAFRQRERSWLSSYDPPAREVLYALLSKYELGGIDQVANPQIFRVPPFQQMGEVRGILRRFGGDPQQLRHTLEEFQRRIYAA